ncbi:MAG: M14 family zinc carboxypeptidase [Planctomycetota bacterium]
MVSSPSTATDSGAQHMRRQPPGQNVWLPILGLAAVASAAVVAGLREVPWASASAPVAATTAAPERFRAPGKGYHGFDDVWRLVRAWSNADPERVRLLDAGTSAGGLAVPALSFGSAPAAAKSAAQTRRSILLVGGLDGRSQSGAEAVLHTAHALLRQLDHLSVDLEVVAIPWASPDGLARVHAGESRSGRDATPVDDDEDGRVDEDGGDDIDGDGLVLEMLLPDPDGQWVRAEDPRFLRPARPGDGPRFRRTVEGRDDDGDGAFNEDGAGGIAMDRQFPSYWTSPGDDGGAGPRPLGAPVAHRLADLVLQRDVVVAFVFQGDHGGVAFPRAIERAQEGAGSDDVHRRIALGFMRSTGRRSETWARPEDKGGRAIDWMNNVLGVTAMEVAVWGPGVCGCDGRPLAELAVDAQRIDHSGHALLRGPALDRTQARWAHWVDDVRGGAGFVDWHPVDLGGGLVGWVGGWEPRTVTDPPEDLLPDALRGIPAYVQNVVAGLPRLSVELLRVERSGELVEIDARITNRGSLPTSMGDTAHARPGDIVVTLDAACDAAILAGDPEVEVGALGGHEISDTLRWVVAAPSGAALRISARSRRGGSTSREVRP